MKIAVLYKYFLCNCNIPYAVINGEVYLRTEPDTNPSEDNGKTEPSPTL